jgi:hypothetical protein
MVRELLSAAQPLAPSNPSEAPRVTVISDNVTTIACLGRYLSDAGFDSQSMRRLPDSTIDLQLGDVVVIFPDEFETGAVLASVEALQRADPHLRLLLITRSPQSYQVRTAIEGALPPVLLPKPAFGWSILDAIRASSSAPVESATLELCR